MSYLFYTLAALLILQGIFSLIEGISFLSFVRRSLSHSPDYFRPKASVIAPCRGLDRDLEENLRALFDQDYPDYEIIFAVGSRSDPACAIIERVIEDHRDRKAKLIIAQPDDKRSDKVNNLLAAIEHASLDSEVFVFVDSDAGVHREWLKALVAPLSDQDVGATTGYRWHLPKRPGLWSAMLSAWNGSVATTLGDHSRNFAWGGSTAIRRDSFDRIGVGEAWRKALSDDYALTRRVQQAGMKIKFVPRCLIPWREDATLCSLLEFTTRQVTITRIYRPRVWWVGFVSHALFVMVFFGGIAWALVTGRFVLFAALAAIYALGSLKGMLRMLAAEQSMPARRDEVIRLWWMYCLLWPLVALLFFYNFISSAMTRRIRWRGIIYEMRSADEIIKDAGHSRGGDAG